MKLSCFVPACGLLLQMSFANSALVGALPRSSRTMAKSILREQRTTGVPGLVELSGDQPSRLLIRASPEWKIRSIRPLRPSAIECVVHSLPPVPFSGPDFNWPMAAMPSFILRNVGGPELFEIVEAAHFRTEDMDDDITRIHQHPVALGNTPSMRMFLRPCLYNSSTTWSAMALT